jgi:hypothetical protein
MMRTMRFTGPQKPVRKASHEDNPTPGFCGYE